MKIQAAKNEEKMKKDFDQVSMEFGGEDESAEDHEENGEVELTQSEDEGRKIYSAVKKKYRSNQVGQNLRQAAADTTASSQGIACGLLKSGAARRDAKSSKRGSSEPSSSQIGGGKTFRQSQIGGKPSNQSVLQSGILSGIRPHSIANLSVIESGDEDESPSQDETSYSETTDHNTKKPLTPIDEKNENSKEIQSGEDDKIKTALVSRSHSYD